MFTGIVTDLGKCEKRSKEQLIINCSKELLTQLNKGSSISVSGVCLTVSSVGDSSFTVSLMPETWHRTNLGSLKPGDKINLEAALSAGARLDGHIVQGHVDGTGTVIKRLVKGNSYIFVIEASSELLAGMVEKGSVTVNGVSLTLIDVSETTFSVGIIPYTYSHTTFGQTEVKSVVNIETDILGKYFLKLMGEKNYGKAN